MSQDSPADNRTEDGRIPPARPVRIALITCAVLEDEVAMLRARSPNLVHVEMMPQGLHIDPPKLRTELQKAIERVELRPEVEAIALGYGLCSRGTEGISTRRCRLVMARAHDCITLLLGSKERFADYVKQHPGTYWYSPGWNRHHTPPGKERYEKLRAQYLAQYGEDNAQFLMESEQHWFNTYDRAAYVELGAGVTEADIQYTKDCADWLKWTYDRQSGSVRLLADLMNGEWDDGRFLVMEPGQSLTMSADERVIQLSIRPRK